MFAFNALSFTIRWFLCLFVVFSTYNPTGFSYYHWITGPSTGDVALKTFLGLMLIITYANFAIIMWRSMGPFGIAAACGILTAMIWVLQDNALFDLNETNALSTTTCIFFATLLAVGISFSHVKTRLQGHTESHYVDYY